MNEILIYGVIGSDIYGDGITAENLKQQLDAIGETDELTIRINSEGGDVFEGVAMFNLLHQHPARKKVMVDGYAVSSASFLAMAGDEILMGVGSQFMIHNPWTVAIGDAKEMRDTAGVLDEVKESIIEIYQTKVSASREDLTGWMDDVKWMRSDEAEKLGFSNGSTGAKASLRKIKDCKWVKNTPQEVLDMQDADLPENRAPVSISTTAIAVYHDYLEQSQRIAASRASLFETRKNLSL